MRFEFKPQHALLLAVATLTIGMRLIVVTRLAHSPYGVPATGDMKFYFEWAQRIAAGEWTDFHAFYAQPLYAYLAGVVFALAGVQPIWLGIIQLFLDAATALLLVEIARLALPGSPCRGMVVGGLAAVGWAFYLPAAAYCGLLIPTSFAVANWWLMVWWLLRRRTAAGYEEWLLMALLLGLSALISAATLFLLPLFIVAMWRQSRRGPWAAVAIGLALGTAPAWLHNALVARDPVFISAHGGLNFWIGNNPEAIGYPKIPSDLPSDQAELLTESIRVAETAASHPLPRSAVSDYWSDKARTYIAAHFLEWLKLELVKIRNFWNAFRYDDLSAITPLRDAGVLPPGISFGVIAALGLAGAVFAWRNARLRLVIVTILLQMLALLPVFINERYRLPAAPGLLLLSAFFLTEVWQRISTQPVRSLFFPAIVLAVTTPCVSRPPIDPALRSVDDFKAGRRQLVANDFGRAEKRLRLATGAVMPPANVAPAVAKMFGESAREKWHAGDGNAARATIAAGLGIQPEEPGLLRMQSALEGESRPPP